MWPGAKQLPAATLDCSCHQVVPAAGKYIPVDASPPRSSMVIAYLPLLGDHSFVVNSCQYHTAEWVWMPGLWIINNLFSDLSFSRFLSLSSWIKTFPRILEFSRIWPDSKLLLYPFSTLFNLMDSTFLYKTTEKTKNAPTLSVYGNISENYLPN